MSFILNSGQFYLIVIAIFAIVGFARGWRREVISVAFIVPTILFLYVGGGRFFLAAHPLRHEFPHWWRGRPQGPPTCSRL